MLFLNNNENIGLLDGLSVTGVCVLIVFLMLIVLALVVSLLQFIGGNKKTEAPTEEAPSTNVPSNPKLKLEDIKDDDMMAAALVATIDYYEETKKDVRVVSIKEIC